MKGRELIAYLDRAAGEIEIIRHPKVFVGGATMPLYVDEPDVEFRPMKDVDCPEAERRAVDAVRVVT